MVRVRVSGRSSLWVMVMLGFFFGCEGKEVL